jgi:hypothetical protein
MHTGTSGMCKNGAVTCVVDLKNLFFLIVFFLCNEVSEPIFVFLLCLSYSMGFSGILQCHFIFISAENYLRRGNWKEN